MQCTMPSLSYIKFPYFCIIINSLQPPFKGRPKLGGHKYRRFRACWILCSESRLSPASKLLNSGEGQDHSIWLSDAKNRPLIWNEGASGRECCCVVSSLVKKRKKHKREEIKTSQEIQKLILKFIWKWYKIILGNKKKEQSRRTYRLTLPDFIVYH